ncbi:glycosyltransferase family 2 protein [Absicoccus intestinalis]|uniref:Glycosyltransferase n=1 Tax=Absicoccus intestinalis TaxID=2926319 RepID=A0ABU4WQM4_9FIRM|nr:glycosyltransferase family 2 protein [Absicoccus sp. CLA-KB-P134]MDX8417835.1 glycosyltransferase [Absicoccus sp. CLA-KB-P134]
MSDLLSIIVLSYKSNNMLYETLDSILDQNYPNIEIVICDDASPVFDENQVKKYISDHKKSNITNIQIIVNSKNVGTVKNLNYGIRSAKGKYIKAIAGDDQLASPEVCSCQINYLKNHPKTNFVVGNILECDDKMNPISKSGFLVEDDHNSIFTKKNSLLTYIVRKNQKALSTQAMCFRKEFFETEGLYDERFLLIEDLPMSIKIVQNEKRIGYINKICVKHRGQVGVSTSNNAFNKRKLKYYEDLEKYYRISLEPIKDTIGKMYVNMRYKICQFRVEYCQLENSDWIGKLKLVIRYSVPLMYYMRTRSSRVLFYLKGESKY